MPENFIAESAEQALFDSMKTLEDNVIEIGKHEKAIEDLKEKSVNELKLLIVFAAHYYSEEKIRELHHNTVQILKCSDFDPEEYIAIFSDSSKIKLKHIHFLLQRQKLLTTVQQTLNTRDDGNANIKKDDFLFGALADFYSKDGANDD